jgi:hypothetical protein
MDRPTRRIEELATVVAGFSPRRIERRKAGQYLLIGGRNIRDGALVTTDADSYVDFFDRQSFRRAIAEPGDIIVSTLFDRRKVYIFQESDPPSVVNSSCAIIRSATQGNYIISYLRTLTGQQDFLAKAAQATGGRFIPRVSVGDLAQIEIPILPFSELTRLTDSRIQDSTSDELAELKGQLESKEDQIQQLKLQNAEMERFFMDRIRAIEQQMATNDLAARIAHGETARLEFKSTLRWHLHKKTFEKIIENEVLGTVVAFCNSKGGEILIGVADDGAILGLDHDRFANTDKFLLHLRNLLADRIVPSVLHFVEPEILSVNGKSICRVECSPSTRDVWLKPDKQSPEMFFIRSGPSSTQLMPRQAVEYIRDHFGDKPNVKD